MLQLVFFFLGSAAHPDLHSFPTRRSSDLTPARAAGSVGGRFVGRGRLGPAVVPADADPILAAVQRDRVEVGQLRSEEHTSELQSHSDLVCRLLLEKKKRQRKRNWNLINER